MASFVGGETAYRTFLSACSEIYAQEGLRGFFAGTAARLFAESLKTTIVCTIIYLGRAALRKAAPSQPNQPDLLQPLLPQFASVRFVCVLSDASLTRFTRLLLCAVQMIASTMTYSLTLVANLMAVNDARLAAANNYRNAFDCYEQLASRGELKRGAQFFFRLVPALPKSVGGKVRLTSLDTVVGHPPALC